MLVKNEDTPQPEGEKLKMVASTELLEHDVGPALPFLKLFQCLANEGRCPNGIAT